jgi:hypothetical protein
LKFINFKFEEGEILEKIFVENLQVFDFKQKVFFKYLRKNHQIFRDQFVKFLQWKKLLCKVEFTLLKSKFLPAKFSFSKMQEKNLAPAKFSFSKIQEKNLAGKNTLQKSEFYFAKE